MEFRLFGEVQLHADGVRVDLGTPRQQAVLAVLLVDAERPVAIDTLVDRVWDDAPPAEARNILYSHLSRIRRLLKQHENAPRLERRHAGYVLELDREHVDLHRFQQLVDDSRDPRHDDDTQATMLTEALGLWRGQPLAGITGEWAAEVRGQWQRRRLDAIVRWANTELLLGRPDPVIGVLPGLTAEFPLVEPLETVLMRALHADGRDAEAVDRYRLLRERLADQLGTDPSADVRELHETILRGEVLPPARQLPAPAPVAETVTPAQLPPDLAGFTGRVRELSLLEDSLLEHDGSAITVSGTAGVGKTALAVHWAHRVRAEFADGQLYVNLRGFDPAGSPVTPAEAVRGFLDAFGVPPEKIPAGLDAQVGLYRSLLAGRRVLVVLDNARDAEQVRPLLPGAPGCLAIVTSRNQLTGLIADGARPLVLDLLDPDDARALLAKRLGAARVAAEPDAVADIITLCARLPLALAVVAARAATHPGFALAVLAEELRAVGLDELAGADPATDPRAVFSWSYVQLSPDAQRLFRLLGLHDGPDISLRAAASLAGVRVSMARRLLAELSAAHLAAERVPGRYACHDLLRAYAAEQAHLVDPEADRRAAAARVLGHYLHSADTADRLLNPHRDAPPSPPPLAPGTEPERMTDREHALAWFAAEHTVLLAAVRGASGFDAEVWHLGWALRRVLAYQGHWQDSLDVLGVALDAADRLDDPAKQAFAHCYLGLTLVRFQRHDDARTHLRAAIDLYDVGGERTGEGFARLYYALMLERQDEHRAALPHARAALDLFLGAGHRAGQAKAFNAIGWFHAMLGDHAEALIHCRRALEVQRELDDRVGLAETWDSLGYVHRRLGQHTKAIACYHSATQLYGEVDDRYNEATSLTSLGHARLAIGDSEGAGCAWRQAVELLDQLGHADAAAVRATLRELTETADRPGLFRVSTG